MLQKLLILVFILVYSCFPNAAAGADDEKLNSRLEDMLAETRHRLRNSPKPKYSSNEYNECLLSDLPGTRIDARAREIERNCFRQYPSLDEPPPRKRHWFSQPTPRSCFREHSKGSTSELAVRWIQEACHELYSER